MFAACGAAALLLPIACGKAPTAPAVSFSSPLPTQANGATYGFGVQPITLTLSNAARIGQSVVTYSVEVATDPGFGSKVFTKDGIPEGSNGKTNVELGSLAGGATYYWHSMAAIDGVVGAPSPTQTFNVRQQIFTGAPSIASPNANDNVFGSRPSFTVNNVGPHVRSRHGVLRVPGRLDVRVLDDPRERHVAGDARTDLVVAFQRPAGRQSVLARACNRSLEFGSEPVHHEQRDHVQSEAVRSEPRHDPE